MARRKTVGSTAPWVTLATPTATWSAMAWAVSAARWAASAAARDCSTACSGVSAMMSPCSSRRLEGRVDDRALAGEAGRLHQLVVPFHRDGLAFLVDQRLDERVEVLRVEARRRGGAAPRHVEVADDLHAVMLHHLTRFGEFA